MAYKLMLIDLQALLCTDLTDQHTLGVKQPLRSNRIDLYLVLVFGSN